MTKNMASRQVNKLC